MEAMPRMPMLSPEFKYAASPLPGEFAVKIKEYILTHYQDDPSKYDSAFVELENLRVAATRFIPDVESACVMKRYYAQMCMIKNRFPMEEKDPIQVPFSWLDKALEMPSAVVFEDINYELSCVMLNIGAVHAAIAVNETRSTPDSMKNAFSHFQCAAWPFQFLRDKMNAVKYSSMDFEPALLTFYMNILLAQAQECLLEKSLIDHRKDTIIAKIALHLRDVYRQCEVHLEQSGLCDLLASSRYKEFVRTCKVKSEVYAAIWALHMGQHAEEQQKMGHRLSWYAASAEHVKAAVKMGDKDKRESLRQALAFLSDVVFAKEANARKENDFIYHEKTPAMDELEKVEGVVLVKAIGFDATDRSIAGDDLFAALLPTNVIRALSLYSEEKAKLKRRILEAARSKDAKLDEYLCSLRLDEISLDASLEQLELPDMLLQRSATFNAQPEAFPELLEKLTHCSIDADHKLNDLSTRLSKIQSSDLMNDEGFIAITKSLQRLSDAHLKARTSNSELQKAIAAHSESLKLLAMPLGELKKRISGPPIKASETAEGAQLKRMLDKVNEMKMQRVMLIDQLANDLDNDEITQKCLSLKHEDNTDLFSLELKKHDHAVAMIETNLAAQEKILSTLTEANANFASHRKQLMQLHSARNEQMVALVAAFDIYADVRTKADQGLHFYAQLFDRVRALDEAVEAIEGAYELEQKAIEEERRRAKMEVRVEASIGDEAGRAPMFPSVVDDVQLPRTRRPRLADYMDFYRNKMAPPSVTAMGIAQNGREQMVDPRTAYSPCQLSPLQHRPVAQLHPQYGDLEDPGYLPAIARSGPAIAPHPQVHAQHDIVHSPRGMPHPNCGGVTSIGVPSPASYVLPQTTAIAPQNIAPHLPPSTYVEHPRPSPTAVFAPPASSQYAQVNLHQPQFRNPVPEPAPMQYAPIVPTPPPPPSFPSAMAFTGSPRGAAPGSISPWHQSMNPSFSPRPPVPTAMPTSGQFIVQPGVAANATIPAYPPPAMNQDVMDMEMGSFSLPAPLLPSACSMPSPAVTVPSHAGTIAVPLAPPASTPMARPAAAVLPIVQQMPSRDPPVRTAAFLEQPDSHSVSSVPSPTPPAPMPSSSRSDDRLADLLNAATFSLGTVDETRAQKRQIKEQFRTQTPQQPSNNADPLNKIDSHFFMKK